MAEIFSAVQVGDEVVCRDCLKMEEMISAQRGITDSYSADDVRETEYTCSRPAADAIKRSSLLRLNSRPVFHELLSRDRGDGGATGQPSRGTAGLDPRRT